MNLDKFLTRTNGKRVLSVVGVIFVLFLLIVACSSQTSEVPNEPAAAEVPAAQTPEKVETADSEEDAVKVTGTPVPQSTPSAAGRPDAPTVTSTPTPETTADEGEESVEISTLRTGEGNDNDFDPTAEVMVATYINDNENTGWLVLDNSLPVVEVINYYVFADGVDLDVLDDCARGFIQGIVMDNQFESCVNNPELYLVEYQVQTTEDQSLDETPDTDSDESISCEFLSDDNSAYILISEGEQGSTNYVFTNPNHGRLLIESDHRVNIVSRETENGCDKTGFQVKGYSGPMSLNVYSFKGTHLVNTNFHFPRTTEGFGETGHSFTAP